MSAVHKLEGILEGSITYQNKLNSYSMELTNALEQIKSSYASVIKELEEAAQKAISEIKKKEDEELTRVKLAIHDAARKSYDVKEVQDQVELAISDANTDQTTQLEEKLKNAACLSSDQVKYFVTRSIKLDDMETVLGKLTDEVTELAVPYLSLHHTVTPTTTCMTKSFTVKDDYRYPKIRKVANSAFAVFDGNKIKCYDLNGEEIPHLFQCDYSDTNDLLLIGEGDKQVLVTAYYRELFLRKLTGEIIIKVEAPDSVEGITALSQSQFLVWFHQFRSGYSTYQRYKVTATSMTPLGEQKRLDWEYISDIELVQVDGRRVMIITGRYEPVILAIDYGTGEMKWKIGGEYNNGIVGGPAAVCNDGKGNLFVLDRVNNPGDIGKVMLMSPVDGTIIKKLIDNKSSSTQAKCLLWFESERKLVLMDDDGEVVQIHTVDYV